MNKASVVTARTLDVQETSGVGVVVDSVHWTHYCEQIDGLEMPTLDEANFYTASASAFVSLLAALLGVLWGTHNPSPYLIAFLAIGSAASLVLTVYFRRAYNRAKVNFTQPASRIARQMREVAEAQAQRQPSVELEPPSETAEERPKWYLQP